MNFKLRQLQGFAAAAHHGSFSAAARELAITQPAFSQLIGELETTVGIRLFERTTRRLELTEPGRRLLAMIAGPLDDLTEAYKFARGIAAGTRGRITFSSVVFGYVTTALAAFKARFPEVRVRLIEDQNVELIARVLNREVDFGIGTLTTHRSELAFREILEDELMTVYRTSHRFAGKRKITWGDLAREPLILLTKHSSARELADRGFATCGIAREPDYEVANMVTALSIVRARLGVTVMPRVVLGELNMKGLRASPIADPHPIRKLGVITRADRPLSAAAAAYVDILVAATRGTARHAK